MLFIWLAYGRIEIIRLAWLDYLPLDQCRRLVGYFSLSLSYLVRFSLRKWKHAIVALANRHTIIKFRIRKKKGLLFRPYSVHIVQCTCFFSQLLWFFPSHSSFLLSFFSLSARVIYLFSCVMDRWARKKKKKTKNKLYLYSSRVKVMLWRWLCVHSFQFHGISKICIKNGSSKKNSDATIRTKAEHFFPSHKKYTIETTVQLLFGCARCMCMAAE